MSEPIDWEDEEERLAARSYASGDPSGWFDELYAAGESGRVTMPWARHAPHPLLVNWIQGNDRGAAGQRAIVVGCGLGADAEYVSRLGYETTAFDIAPTAVAIARRRHPDSNVNYEVANLLELPMHWRAAFDLVIEIITVQALPDPLRARGITAVSSLLAPAGTLLVIAAIHNPSEPVNPTGPWPLTRAEIDAFANKDVTLRRVEQLASPSTPDELRWRAEFRRAT